MQQVAQQARVQLQALVDLGEGVGHLGLQPSFKDVEPDPPERPDERPQFVHVAVCGGLERRRPLRADEGEEAGGVHHAQAVDVRGNHLRVELRVLLRHITQDARRPLGVVEHLPEEVVQAHATVGLELAQHPLDP